MWFRVIFRSRVVGIDVKFRDESLLNIGFKGSVKVEAKENFEYSKRGLKLMLKKISPSVCCWGDFLSLLFPIAKQEVRENLSKVRESLIVPAYQNYCPHWKTSPLLLFWGQPKIRKFLPSSVMTVNMTNRGCIALMGAQIA